ncbi:MAG: DUF6758 family protein [Sporichthyaceae bacterium]
MTGVPSCSRCGGTVRAPGIWSNAWRCERDGDVDPLHVGALPTHDRVLAAMKDARVPFWIPWPLPIGWLATGFTYSGDERSGARASLLTFGGPNPLGGFSELAVISEEPGVGLGASWAGLPGPDPGERLATTTGPHARIHAGGHPTALWCIDSGDRAVYVGEALGLWLWLILWPAGAGALVFDQLRLVDLRDAPRDLDIPMGAMSARLDPLARRAG